MAVFVSDTGTGMSEEVRGHAFEPFFTTKGPRDGTGLGLSQVYGFVKQSGGHVMIYSEPGHGTTVKLYLPRLDEDRRGRQPAARFERAPSRAPATVLLVEDDDRLRGLAAASLASAGHAVEVAADAQAALARLDAGVRPDLLLTDVRLGAGPDGRQLAEEVQRRLGNIRVLFTTAYARNAVVHHGRLDHGARLLTKPFTQAELVEKVKDVLEEPANRGAVLLVEDEPFVALVARQILEDHGFEVTVASHASVALAHARAARDDVGRAALVLAVVDVGLPDMRGDELVHQLVAITPQLPVIIATGYGTQELESQFGAIGHVALIGKPYDGATLRAALIRLGFDVSLMGD